MALFSVFLSGIPVLSAVRIPTNMSFKSLLAASLAFLLPAVSFSQWKQETSPLSKTAAIYDVHFLSNQVGFLGTSEGILKTADGGATWAKGQSPTPSDQTLLGGAFVSDIHFFNTTTGVLVGTAMFNTYDVIARTTDGGTSWSVTYYKPMGSAVGRLGLSSVSFTTASIGFAVGSDGTVLRTQDGGVSWITVTTTPATGNLRKVLFVNDQTGFIAGDNILLKTTNGGATWDNIVTTYNINDLYFFDTSRGIASTSIGAILHTADGGATWQESPFNVGVDLGNIAFQGQTGYILSYSTIFLMPVLKTTDGGATWETQTFPNSNMSLQGISITPAGKVWAGGFEGRLYSGSTTDNVSTPMASFTAPGALFCAGPSYTFKNNGPASGQTFEWRLDGTLVGSSHNLTTALPAGSHTLSLTARKGTLSSVENLDVLVEPSSAFTKPLQVTYPKTMCAGQPAVFTVADPERGTYQLLQGGVPVASVTVNNTTPSIILATPTLTTATVNTFQVVGTRANSCETATTDINATITVYDDILAGTTISVDAQHSCQGGKPVISIANSHTSVQYDIYQEQTLLGNVTGTGGVVTFTAPAVSKDAYYRVKAHIGSCEQWLNDNLAVDVQRVKADFYLSSLNAENNQWLGLVKIFNQSIDATSFEWTFSGASVETSNDANPDPIWFSQPGMHEVTLRVSGANGCSDVVQKSVTVYDRNNMPGCWATSIGVNLPQSTYPADKTFAMTITWGGGFVVSGMYEAGTAMLDSKTGARYTAPAATGRKRFLAKYASEGVVKWAFVATPDIHQNPHLDTKLRTAQDQSIYMLAWQAGNKPEFYSANGDTLRPTPYFTADQQYLVKYTSDGEIEWIRSQEDIAPGGGVSDFADLEIDEYGMLYLVSDKLYILSPAGDVVSSFPLQLPGYPKELVVTPDGIWCFLPTGWTGTTVHKYSYSGELLLETSVPGEMLQATADLEGNIVVSGSTYGPTSFPSVGEADHTADVGSIYFVRYNTTGQVQWINAASPGHSISSHGLSVNESGEIYTVVQSNREAARIRTQESEIQVNDGHALLVGFNADGGVARTQSLRAYFFTERVGDDGIRPEVLDVATFAGPVYVYGAVEQTYNGDMTFQLPNLVLGDAIKTDQHRSFFIASIDGSDCVSAQPKLVADSHIDPADYLCPNTTVDIDYRVQGGVRLGPGNIFDVYLISDQNTTILRVGSLATQDPEGKITVTIPEVPSNAYTFRLIGSNPTLYSPPTDDYFMINPPVAADYAYTRKDAYMLYSFTASGGNGTDYTWAIEGQTLTGAQVEHRFTAPGTYNVCMTTRGGSCDLPVTICKDITVTCTQGLPAFTYQQANKTVTFTNTSASEYTSFVWSFGDGTTASTRDIPPHMYAVTGSYSVTLKATGPCGELTTTKTVSVSCAQGTPAFTLTQADNTVTFTNTSTSEFTNFRWSFGDGATAATRDVSPACVSGAGLLFRNAGGCGAMQRSLFYTDHHHHPAGSHATQQPGGHGGGYLCHSAAMARRRYHRAIVPRRV